MVTRYVKNNSNRSADAKSVVYSQNKTKNNNKFNRSAGFDQKIRSGKGINKTSSHSSDASLPRNINSDGKFNPGKAGFGRLLARAEDKQTNKRQEIRRTNKLAGGEAPHKDFANRGYNRPIIPTAEKNSPDRRSLPLKVGSVNKNNINAHARLPPVRPLFSSEVTVIKPRPKNGAGENKKDFNRGNKRKFNWDRKKKFDQKKNMRDDLAPLKNSNRPQPLRFPQQIDNRASTVPASGLPHRPGGIVPRDKKSQSGRGSENNILESGVPGSYVGGRRGKRRRGGRGRGGRGRGGVSSATGVSSARGGALSRQQQSKLAWWDRHFNKRDKVLNNINATPVDARATGGGWKRGKKWGGAFNAGKRPVDVNELLKLKPNRSTWTNSDWAIWRRSRVAIRKRARFYVGNKLKSVWRDRVTGKKITFLGKEKNPVVKKFLMANAARHRRIPMFGIQTSKYFRVKVVWVKEDELWIRKIRRVWRLVKSRKGITRHSPAMTPDFYRTRSNVFVKYSRSRLFYRRFKRVRKLLGRRLSFQTNFKMLLRLLNRRFLRLDLPASLPSADSNNEASISFLLADFDGVDSKPALMDIWYLNRLKRKIAGARAVKANPFSFFAGSGIRFFPAYRIRKIAQLLPLNKRKVFRTLLDERQLRRDERAKAVEKAHRLFGKQFSHGLEIGRNITNYDLLEVGYIDLISRAFSSSWTYFYNRVVRRSGKAAGSRWRSIDRKGYSLKSLLLFNLISKRILCGASATYRRRSSPFVSGLHMLWLDATIRQFKGRDYKYGWERDYSRAGVGLINSPLFSRKLFFGDTRWLVPGRIRKHAFKLVKGHYRMIRRVKGWRYAHGRKRLRQVKDEWLLKAKKQSKFYNDNKRKEAAIMARKMLEGRPFWTWNITGLLSNFTRPVPHVFWSPQARANVKRTYFKYIDPFSSPVSKAHQLFSNDEDFRDNVRTTPFAGIDRLKNVSSNFKISASIFSVFLAKALAGVVARSAAPKSGKSDEYIANLEKMCRSFLMNSFKLHFSSITREHRNIVADCSLVLTALSRVKYFNEEEKIETVGEYVEKRRLVPELGMRGWEGLDADVVREWGESSAESDDDNSGSSVGDNERVPASLHIDKSWYVDPLISGAESIFPRKLRAALTKKVRRFDLTHSSLLAETGSIPRNYLFMDDTSRSNFTRANANNALSFVKYITDVIAFIGREDIFGGESKIRQGEVIKFLLSKVSRLTERYSSFRKAKSLARRKFVRAGMSKFFKEWVGRSYRFHALIKRYGLRRARSLALRLAIGAKGKLWKNVRKTALYSTGLWGVPRRVKYGTSLYEEFVFRENLLVKLRRPWARLNKEGIQNKLETIKMELRRPGYFLASMETGAPVDPLFSNSNRKMSVRSLFHKSYVLRNKNVPRSTRLSYHTYYFRHVWARRVRDYMLAASYYNKPFGLASKKNMTARVFDRYARGMFSQPRWLLFKLKPDTVGRSRVFFHLKKKPKSGRKFSRASRRFIYSFMPPLRLRSRFLMSLGRNTHLARRVATRISHRRMFRYKFMLRHAVCARWKLKTSNLLHKWNSIQNTGRKWFTWYDKFEAHLHRFLRASRLVRGKKLPKTVIKSGMVSINGVVCINPFYKVKPGDVIVLNNEFYWTYITRRLWALVNRLLKPLQVKAGVRRRIIHKALKVIQRQYAAGAVRASLGPKERKLFKLYGSLFMRDSSYKNMKRQKRAPGGAPFIRQDAFAADVNLHRFDGVPSYHASANAKYARALTKIFKVLETSAFNDSSTHYRFHNALFFKRLPVSPEEYFSSAKMKATRLHNPFAIRFMLSHRFWH